MIRNVGLSSALNLYRVGIQFLLNIVLAHYLSPNDFAQVALVLPVALFILLVGDFGLNNAIISQPMSKIQVGAAARICLCVGISIPALAVTTYSLGLLQEISQDLALLLIAFAIVTALAMAAIVPRAVLERSLRYQKLTSIETVANMAAFGCAIGAASLGCGVWSFAIYHLVLQTIRCACFHQATRNDIAHNASWRLALPLMHFGGWVLAFNLVNYLMRNADRYFINIWVGPDSLGLYALAYQIMLVPLMMVTWPASSVLLSTLSRVKNEPLVHRSALFSVLTLASVLTFPMVTFIALRADLVFGLILPDDWQNLGPIVGKMAIAGGLQSVTAFIGVLFLVSGKIRTQFAFGLATTILTLTTQMVILSMTHSLMDMVNAYVLLTILLSAGYFVFMARLLDVSIIHILRPLMPAAIISLIAATLMLAIETLLQHSTEFSRLIMDMLIFSGTVTGLLWLRRGKLFQHFITLQSTGQIATIGTDISKAQA